jgi:hypothetical protein
MARKVDPPRLDPEIAALVAVLEEGHQDLIDGMVNRIQKEISFYRTPAVDRADLWTSCDANVRDILTPLITGRSVDLTSPGETGTRRAAQHAPLPAVMAAYRVGFRHLWEAMVTHSRRRGLASSDALVGAASTLWAAHDAYTDAMTTAYRDAMTTEMIRNERERSALVDALLDGRLSDMTDIWDAAEVLRLPSKGTYVVIAAEVPQIAHEALPGAESRLAGRGIGSAWCLRADLQIGVACVPAKDRLTTLVAALREMATARVGISPGYPALDQTAPALRLARLAMAATPVGEVAVTRFDAHPLAVTAISASEILPRISRTVFGPLLDLPPDDQAILLETLEAWRDNDGSAAAAAAALYCHPNTVRHRLRRIEQLTGRSLTSPRAAAELCLALEGVRLLPDIPPS